MGKVIVLVMVIVMVAQPTWADADQEYNLLDIYREKKYVGADDEGELKVLPNVITSENLKKKSAENEGF